MKILSQDAVESIFIASVQQRKGEDGTGAAEKVPIFTRIMKGGQCLLQKMFSKDKKKCLFSISPSKSKYSFSTKYLQVSTCWGYTMKKTGRATTLNILTSWQGKHTINSLVNKQGNFKDYQVRRKSQKDNVTEHDRSQRVTLARVTRKGLSKKGTLS